MQALDFTVSGDVVRRAIFDMSPFKTPRSDGFHVFFFQHNWGVVGNSVVQFVCNIFRGTTSVKSVNSILIVSIPKVVQPESLYNFWPISLFNILYKLIAKVIVNQIQSLLPNLISPNHVSFVIDRHI